MRLQPGDPAPATLAMVAGIALRAAVVAAGVPDDPRLLLKWPNDLLLDWAKLAGILLEREGDAVVAGFGVNLSVAPPVSGRATAALRDVASPPDPDTFQAMLAQAWDVAVAQWRAAPLDATLAAWRAVAIPDGPALVTHDVDGQRVTGDFAGLADDGALRLRLADGSLKHIHAGDVLLAGEG